MLGKIEYDVEVPEKPKKLSELTEFFLGFMADKVHKSVSIDYGDRERCADRSYSSLRKIITRDSIDVSLNVRSNILYITKNNFTPDKVVLPASITTKQKIEKSIAKEVEVKKTVPKAKRGRPSKLQSEDIFAYRMVNPDATQKQIAEHFGCSIAKINQTLNSKYKKKKEFSEEKNGITDAELAKIAGK